MLLNASQQSTRLGHAGTSRSSGNVYGGRDGSRTVTDGPFPETREMVGGYFMIECPSEAEALEWAKKLPPFFNFQARQVWEM